MEKKSRNWVLVLYPQENEQHENLIENIKEESIGNFKYVMIDHFGEHNEDDTQRKNHTHILVKFQNNIYKNSLAKRLRIQENDLHFLQPCTSYVSYLKYMIHHGYPDKKQYSLDDLKGDSELRFVLMKSIKAEGVEENRVKEIFDFIESYVGYIKISDVMNYCLKYGLWSDFRRSQTAFLAIIKEHNQITERRL